MCEYKPSSSNTPKYVTIATPESAIEQARKIAMKKTFTLLSIEEIIKLSEKKK